MIMYANEAEYVNQIIFCQEIQSIVLLNLNIGL